MRITIIPSDKTICIDGDFLLSIQQDISWVPENIHAVQWYNTWGEVEYTDDSPNERIEELGIYQQAVIDFNNELKRIEDEQKAQEASRDYWEELRSLRNQRLTQYDWTQVYDAPLTELQKTAWQTYRQQLRDLPENITEPKPLVLDSNYPSWPTVP